MLNFQIARESARDMLNSARQQSFRKGANIYWAGADGAGWRVVRGLVRLDAQDHDGNGFAGMALPGDVIGIEALLHGKYRFSARALTPCELVPWRGDTGLDAMVALLRLIEAAEQRTAEVVALRVGGADDRIARLLTLLRRGEPEGGESIALPSLRDIADITGLTVETSSRVICRLRREGYLGKRSKGSIAMAWPLPAISIPAFA